MAETALAAFLNDAASRRVVQEIDRDAKVQRGTVRNAAWTFRTDRSRKSCWLTWMASKIPSFTCRR